MGTQNRSLAKRLRIYLIFVVEVGIVAGLVLKHWTLYEFAVPKLLLFGSPILACAHWIALKRAHVPLRPALTLFLLTGPSLLLSMSLFLGRTYELRHVALVGGGTKELAEAARRAGVSNENSPQWVADAIERMHSERAIYAMLLASTFVLYVSRYSAARGGAIQHGGCNDSANLRRPTQSASADCASPEM